MAYPRFTYSFFRYEYTEMCALSFLDEPFLEYFLVLIIPVCVYDRLVQMDNTPFVPSWLVQSNFGTVLAPIFELF